MNGSRTTAALPWPTGPRGSGELRNANGAIMAETPQHLARLATAELVESARALTGMRLTRPEFASTHNVSGVRTKKLTFSRRHDSRTLFVVHADYGHQRPAGAWVGADKTPLAA